MQLHAWAALASGVLCSFVVSGEESAYYKTFRETIPTNDLVYSVGVGSRLLTDPGNTGAKVSGSTNSLVQMKTEGGVSGVRLGMNMSQVVDVWGKPAFLHTNLRGGPHFWYPEVGLFFRGDALREICIPVGNRDKGHRVNPALRFVGGVSAESVSADVIRVLGAPVERTSDPASRCEYLVWQAGEVQLKTGFDMDSKRLVKVILEKRDTAGDTRAGGQGRVQQP